MVFLLTRILKNTGSHLKIKSKAFLVEAHHGKINIKHKTTQEKIMDKNTLVIGILLSLFVALIIYSIFKSKITNNLLKNILIGVIVLLGVISPTFIALTVNSLITPDKVMNKKYEQAFLDNARKELAKEYPNKLYSPNKKIKGNDEFSKQGAIDSLTSLLNDVRQKQSATEVKR